MSAAPSVRGWCPGLVRPMPTGDGLLVRVHPQAGRLTAIQLRAVAEAARTCGNGTVEVSSRANLQIRGVTDATHPELVRILGAAGLAEAPGGGPYRPCVVSPLAGLDPEERFDSFALACAIDDALAADDRLAGLPAKFGIVVDGGGRFPLDEVSPDIRVAAAADGAILIGVADGPGIRWLRPVAPEEAAGAVHAVASALARALARSGARRTRDVAADALANLSLPTGPSPPPRIAQARRVGAIPVRDRSVALLGLAFGRCDADRLASVAALAESFGRGEIRTAPWRALALPGLREGDVRHVLAAAENAGFVASPDDPRLSISACPGRPACASAEATTLADAQRLAPLLRNLPAASTVHISGCAKGCARRAAADLTLVGENGGYRVVLDGDTKAAGIGPMPFAEVLTRLAAGGSLRTAFTEPA